MVLIRVIYQHNIHYPSLNLDISGKLRQEYRGSTSNLKMMPYVLYAGMCFKSETPSSS